MSYKKDEMPSLESFFITSISVSASFSVSTAVGSSGSAVSVSLIQLSGNFDKLHESTGNPDGQHFIDI